MSLVVYRKDVGYMKLSMSVDFRILKDVGNGKYVPTYESEVASIGIGGFCFTVGDKQIPFDWTAYSGNWDDRGYYSFVTGYGWMNDFELDECFDEEYEKLGIKREEISAKMLASAQAIDEFYVDFEVDLGDEGGIEECGVGENTDKAAEFKLELLRISFKDIETGRTYDMNPVVLDAFNKGEKLYVRELNEDDGPQVAVLDELSSNYVAQWLDSEEYGWGLFKNDELIGYCTIGWADDVCQNIRNYPGYSCDSLLLSDVYIKSEERGQGYAAFMVDEAVKMRTENEKELVFLTLLYDDLSNLYQKCGFEVIQPGLMVRDERVRTLEAVLADATQTCEEVNNGVSGKEGIDYEK